MSEPTERAIRSLASRLTNTSAPSHSIRRISPFPIHHDPWLPLEMPVKDRTVASQHGEGHSEGSEQGCRGGTNCAGGPACGAGASGSQGHPVHRPLFLPGQSNYFNNKKENYVYHS